MKITPVLRNKIQEAAQGDTRVFLKIYEENALFNQKTADQWVRFFAEQASDASDDWIARRCGCSPNTVRRWRKIPPYHREDYVAIGCCFALTVENVSQIMTRYGGFSRLNTHSLQDIIYIRLLEIMQERLKNQGVKTVHSGGVDSSYILCDRYTLLAYSNQTSQISQDVDLQLINSINKNKKRINQCYLEVAKLIICQIRNIGFESNNHFYQAMNIPSSLQRICSQMSSVVNSTKKDKLMAMPNRRQLIAIGLYLGLPLLQINELLNAAQMEELCSRTPYEAALLYVLQNLYYKSDDYSGTKMMGKDNIRLQFELRKLFNDEIYKGLFGYVHAKLSYGDLAEFLKSMEVDLNKEMCIPNYGKKDINE